MKSLTVKRGQTTYLLYNLSQQRMSELKNDPKELTSYFDHCYRTGLNICVQVNGENFSTSATSVMRPHSNAFSNASSTKVKFSFLCGNFFDKNFIYATKFGKHPWHYFTEKDSLSSEHGALPASIDASICQMKKVTPIDVNLDEEQSRNYYVNGRFIFKNKELKTHMELSNKKSDENKPNEKESVSKFTDKNTSRLVFASGQSNPLFFLNDFEKCRDLKTDKDKMFKIRHFVDECHKAEFTRLYFTSEWQTVRSIFLKLYSQSFVTNKKRELQIDFQKSTSLRSFVERKLMSLSTFTSLPFINQVEMVMNDLPVEISRLFITYEKMTSDKSEILDFCDSIQDLVWTMQEAPEVPVTNDPGPSHRSNVDVESSQLNRMETVELSEQSDSMQTDEEAQSSRGIVESTGVIPKRGRGRPPKAVVIAKRGRGRPRKTEIMGTIQECTESSDYDFMRQVDNSSRSSWSDY